MTFRANSVDLSDAPDIMTVESRSIWKLTQHTTDKLPLLIWPNIFGILWYNNRSIRRVTNSSSDSRSAVFLGRNDMYNVVCSGFHDFAYTTEPRRAD